MVHHLYLKDARISNIVIRASLVFLILLGSSASILVSLAEAQQSHNIPSWIKNNAKWWSEDQIGDDDFVKGMQYLVQQNILVIPQNQSNSNATTGQEIPSWIKSDAGWWANGLVSDDEFIKGIEYMISQGIIETQFSMTCQAINDILPDPKCTPGETDTSVTQDNIGSTICVSGYAQTVSPPDSLTEPTKFRLMRAYGFTYGPSYYELDYLIPLELGGAPTEAKNLWPEPYYTNPNAHDKDGLENYLHDQVCSGAMDLQTAQNEIATDWVKYWDEAGRP